MPWLARFKTLLCTGFQSGEILFAIKENKELNYNDQETPKPWTRHFNGDSRSSSSDQFLSLKIKVLQRLNSLTRNNFLEEPVLRITNWCNWHFLVYYSNDWKMHRTKNPVLVVAFFCAIACSYVQCGKSALLKVIWWRISLLSLTEIK